MNPEDPAVPEQPKLNELALTLPLEQPEPLLTFLAERGIQTLADVRRAGGLGRIEGLPLAADHPAVHRLEALANLGAVSPDSGVSTALIERGYDSLLGIARAPRTEFVAAVRDQVGDFKAARMHVEARAQTMYLNNALTGILAARANGHSTVPYGDVQAIESVASPTKCGCKDCDAAVSPLAYLADLLDYSVRHLKQTGGTQASSRMSALSRISADDNGNDGNGSGDHEPPPPPQPPPLTQPKISPNGGHFDHAIKVTLTAPANIFYTLDGTIPTTNSTKYVVGSPINLANETASEKTIVLQAVSARYSNDTEEWKLSRVASATFTFAALQTVAPPTITPNGGTLITPNGGTFPGQASIWISTDTQGADIYFTLDGSEPTPSSLKYTHTIRLTPGSVTVKAKAFKSGMADSDLASTAFTVIGTPANLPGRGLMGEYYGDTDLTDLKIVRTDATVNFDWDISSPHPLIAPDNFSARWTGLIEPLYSEEYTFYTVSDDGIAVWIDGTKIIDAWWPQAPAEWSGEISLAAGKKHSIRIEYFENYGGAVAMLLWSSDHQAKEIVPQSQLYPSVDLQFLANTFHQPFDKLPTSCDAADEQFRQARLCIEVLRSCLSTEHIIVGRPVVTLRGPDVYVYARWTDGRLLEFYKAQGSKPWRVSDLSAITGGTYVAGDPAVLLMGSDVHVYVRGADGQLLEFYKAPNPATWQAYATKADTRIAGDPAVLQMGSDVHVYVRGTDGQLLEFYKAPNPAAWLVYATKPDTPVAGDPAVLQMGADVHIYVRGTDGHLLEFYKAPNPSPWMVYAASTEVYIAGDPAVLLTGSDVRVYVRGIAWGGDQLLEFYKAPDPATWVVYATNTDTDMRVSGDPAVLLTGSDVEVYVPGIDGNLLGFHKQPGQVRWGVEVVGNVEAAGEDAYRLAAYMSLLTRLGASFTEIRLARSADVETRKALADRLGIDLGAARPDHLDELFLDPTAVPATLTESKLEEIFGLRDTRDPVTDTPSPSSLEKLRLDHLRTLWREQDWPTDPYSPDYQPQDERLPAIDSDLIGADDFRVPIKKTNPDVRDNPFDIWLERRNWVDKRWQDFAKCTKERRGQIVPDLGNMLGIMKDDVTYPLPDDPTPGTPPISLTPWPIIPDLDKLRRDLTQATDDKTRTDAADSVKKDLHLTLESFIRLMDLRDKDTSAESDPRYDGLTDEEWQEVYSILTQATKVAFYAQWIQEEQGDPNQAPKVRLGMADFGFSLREPVEGVWPPLLLGLDPLIDPERISDVDLAKVIPGKAALTLWQARQARLDQIHKALKAKREDPAGGFEAMLKLALGDPNPGDPLPTDVNLDTLYNNLKNNVDVENTKQKIRERLYMTSEAFLRLMTIKSKEAETDPAKKPTEAEYEEVYTILTSAQKTKREYAQWLNEEKQLPLIDPESVKTSNLPEPTAGKDALDLWQARRARLDQIHVALKAAREQLGFDAMLKLALGDPLPYDLDALYANLQHETDVDETHKKITTGLYMTVEDFKRLMVIKIKSQDSKSAPPTTTEWAEVYAILTSAQKMRVEYPSWLSKEQQFGLTPQNYWRVFKAALPRWRASAEARQQWKQALRTRSSAPIIDPDQVVPGDLKKPVPEDTAFKCWNARDMQISNQMAALKADREASTDPLQGFDSILFQNIFPEKMRTAITNSLKSAREAQGLTYILKRVFGDPLPDLNQIRTDLNSADQATAAKARRTITRTLYLTVDAFVRLMTIKDKDAAGTPPITSTEWDDVYSMLTQALLVASIMTLDDQRSKGNDIAARLEQFSLDNPSFSYLLRIRKLIAENQSVLSAEWEAVYSILVQVKKQRLFAEWREQEQQAGMTLGPDFFRFPEEDKTIFPPPPPPWEPIPWRSTWEMRRDWQDTLQSRMDQEEAVKTALQSVVSATEEATLPMLRDALIMATDAAGTTLEDKAKWLTDRLLIDTRVNGCQMTTRVAQAIETIQGVLWSLRTGQLRDTYPDLYLAAPDFDEEWKWIGSYASWRAAMFVFMYPENILLPSLRKHQTPAFRNLVNELRNNHRLTPEQACQAAKAYSDYFRDVCSLKLEACAEAKTRTYSGDCRNRSEGGYRVLHYLFARSPVSGKAYWCTHDPNTASDYAQTFWDEVQGLKDVINMIGAVVYESSPKERHLYLFARTQDNGQQKLVFVRYDLENALWDQTPKELELPEKATSFTAQVRKLPVDAPPQMGIWLSNGIVYSVALSQKGVEWDSKSPQRMYFADWRDVLASDLGDPQGFELRFSRLASYAEKEGYSAGYPNFHEADHGQGIVYGTILFNPLVVDVQNIRVSDLGNPSGNRALFQAIHDYVQQRSQIPPHYVGGFPNYKVKFLGGEPFMGVVLIKPQAAEYKEIKSSDLDPHTTEEDTFRAVNDYAVRRGYVSGFPNFKARSEDIDILVGVILIKPASQAGVLLEPFLPDCNYIGTTPKYGGPFDIVDRLSADQLQARSTQIRKAFEDNQGASKSLLTYFEEAWYFMPLYLALQLQARGQYMAALDWLRTIYDHSAPLDQRKIYYGLVLEQSLPEPTSQHPDWSDPLNPHLIAETRPNTYTRYTLFSLIRCFLEYADAEFTRDTAESVPRARTLYLTALELLDTLQDVQQPEPCEALIRELDAQVYQGILSEAPQWLPVWFEIKRELVATPDLDELKKVIDGANGVSDALGKRPWSSALSLAWQRIRDAKAAPPAPPTMAELLRDKTRLLDIAYTGLMASPVLAKASLGAGNVAGNRFLQSVSTASGISAATLESEKVDLPWLRNPLMNSTDGQRELTALATSASGTAVSAGNTPVDVQPSFGYVPILTFQFCIPPNPVLNALKLHAELNLYKLRNCRNIAGMRRQLDVYAAPTDTTSGLPMIGVGGQLILPGTTVLHPTPYRYKVLIERAKQLVAIAQQMEAAMLSALEKRDLEAYNLLKARQDVRMASAGVRLQDLKVKEAEDGKKLAELQRDKARIMEQKYEDWINAGMNQYELAMKSNYEQAMSARAIATFADTAVQMAEISTRSGGNPYVAAALAAAITARGFETGVAVMAETAAQIASVYASYERRRQEWELQLDLARQDERIGDQQIDIAEDHVRVVGQERAIAEMQRDHAAAMVEFLSTKFTNVELYEWMSGILENVYSFFLQQATSVAKLAENQLAFERQETPPAYIQSDYWEAPSNEMGVSGDSKGPDRHGLTGSARLLQDIYQLDQYAFENDKRKLQLSKTISLARMAPYEFQRFRETGVLNFATPLELFDRDFPGHYLRLIKRVRTSVVALIPPTQGIHATLSNVSGMSRVVIGPDVFQTVVVRRDPDSVALTAPLNASGLFELEPQSEMLFPFEGLGVGTSWEFRLPQAANLFDYSTIADVLLAIEYTALDSFDYRQQVIQTLSSTISGDRQFSFRQEFADAWYDLHNPDQATPPPMTVTFETQREDFPPNIADLKIQHILLYFACTDGNVLDDKNVRLKFKAKGEANAVGGDAKPIDGVIGTRRGNAGSWLAMTDKKSPAGVWTLSLAPETRQLFDNEVIEDIMLVITYSGRTPEWPA